MYRLVDGSLGRINDPFNCCMTTSDNENDAVGGIYGQRDFLHFQVGTPSPLQEDQMESGCHFGRLAHPREIAFRPRAAETKGLWRLPVEISHFRRKGLVALVDRARQSRREYSEIFLR